MSALELVVLDVPSGAAMESQSGLFANRPRIYGALSGPRRGKVGAIVMHPTSNFMGHYLLEPLAARGISCLALNSRYVNNDAVLVMERVLQDLGAGVRFMRERFDTVVLLGNSGGAALMSFYQAQAENLTVTHTPAGDPLRITAEDLPPADGIAILAGHPGRSHLMLHWLDASVSDEADPLAADPALDIYNPVNQPFGADFVARVRAAQRARSERITCWVQARLRLLRALPAPIHDEAMMVYRTYADPRFVDLDLDPNDRKPGGNRGGGNPRSINYGVNSLCRYTSLTAWMSQWSLLSQADGPANMALTSVPALHLEYTADGSIFPTDIQRWSAAMGQREEFHRIRPGTHYLAGQPELVEEVATLVADWATGITGKVAKISESLTTTETSI
ncbi:MAG: alpha/beta hydrolase [Variovorax sp.]